MNQVRYKEIEENMNQVRNKGIEENMKISGLRRQRRNESSKH
jgi:hypothetical protein